MRGILFIVAGAVTPGDSRPQDCTPQSNMTTLSWRSRDRATLASVPKQGQLVVHYEGCDLTVLEDCHGPTPYKYAGVEPVTKTVTIRDDDTLYRAIPQLAKGLQAKLAKSGQLNIDTMMVGKYTADTPSRADLKGDCTNATHVVPAFTVGASQLTEGKRSEGEAAFGPVSATSTSTRDSTVKEGDPAACKAAKSDDSGPPDGCRSVLSLELVPLK
jgi:hypothetical protein